MKSGIKESIVDQLSLSPLSPSHNRNISSGSSENNFQDDNRVTKNTVGSKMLSQQSIRLLFQNNFKPIKKKLAEESLEDKDWVNRKIDQSYKNEAYRKLPENVRRAIDVAKLKSKHSDFYYKLKNLNEKILIFKSIFYSKVPKHQRLFLERKKN